MATLWQIFKGDYLPISLALQDSTGGVFNLTGYNARLQFAWNFQDGSTSSIIDDTTGFTLASSSSTLTMGSTAGTITGAVAGDDTDNFPAARDHKVNLTLISSTSIEATYRIGYLMVRDDGDG